MWEVVRLWAWRVFEIAGLVGGTVGIAYLTAKVAARLGQRWIEVAKLYQVMLAFGVTYLSARKGKAPRKAAMHRGWVVADQFARDELVKPFAGLVAHSAAVLAALPDQPTEGQIVGLYRGLLAVAPASVPVVVTDATAEVLRRAGHEPGRVTKVRSVGPSSVNGKARGGGA
jgi:uncharacterized membrane protein YfcA